MANIPMKDIQFPGLDDTYTFAQVDDTLTTQGKAADAKKTGDEITELKNDLTQVNENIYLFTDNSEIVFSDPSLKQFINTNVAVGTIVSWDTPSVSSNQTNWKWAVVPCEAGDVFILNGNGATNALLWAFLDADKKLIIKSASNASANNLKLIAPNNSAYIVINDSQNKSSYIGIPIKERTSGLETDMNTVFSKIGGETDNLHNYLNDTVGAYWNDNYEEVVETGTTKYYRHTELIDIEGYSKVRYANGSNPALGKRCWFVSENNTGISSFPMKSADTIDVPENAKYITFSAAKANTSLEVYGVYTGIINEVIQSDVGKFDTLSFVQENGYGNLLDKTWVRGGWYGYGDFRTTTYKYRAGIPTLTHFDKDTQLLCKRGFQITGTAKIGEDVVSTANSFSCMFFIPAGSDATITVRRITEDETEELTDEQVMEFASSVMITSVRGSDYELTKDTYTGLEMYETMGIIGDSYSAGLDGNNWGKCLGRVTGVEVTVWAQSGYDSSEWITGYMSAMLSAEPLDLYWLNLGINDGAAVVQDSSYLGTSADVNEETYPDYNDFPNTFWGNYGRIIRNIQTHAPNAKIVMEKTLFANMRNAQTDLPTTATLTINNAIQSIAEYYGLPCIDQLDDPFYTSREYAQSITSNHPRKYAWVGMANANRRLFTKAVLKNPSYFY